jgi:hypothetical protein
MSMIRWLRRRPILAAVFFLAIAIWVCSGVVQLGRSTPPAPAATYLLPAGSVHAGDLLAIARIVDLRENAKVEGNASIVGFESVTIGGTIHGDLSIFASGVDVYFRPDMRVEGDLNVCARSLNGLNPEHINGSINKGCEALSDALRKYGVEPMDFGFSGIDFSTFLPFFRGYGDLGQVIVNTLVVAGLGALAAAVVPYHYQRIMQTTINSTIPAGIVGFLTVAAVLLVSVVYSVLGMATLGVLLCLGLPVMGILWIVVYFALLLGWIAAAYPLGTWIMGLVGMTSSRVQAAALGAGVLTLAQGLVSLIPCVGIVGWLALVVIGSVGLGAVLLTRAGLRPYPEVISVKRKHGEEF